MLTEIDDNTPAALLKLKALFRKPTDIKREI